MPYRSKLRTKVSDFCKFCNRLNKRPSVYLIPLLVRGALIRDGHFFERGAYKIFLEKLGLKLQKFKALFYNLHLSGDQKSNT